MTRYILICMVLLTGKSYPQEEYKMAQGFYNLSKIEVASGIYLLENKTFFYYASFGNVDLKVFGNYKIHNDSSLTFQPDKELMQEFYIYGTTTDQNDSIILDYRKPFDEQFENLTVNNIPFPEFNSDKNTVSISIKRPNYNRLNFEYFSSPNRKEDFSLQVAKNVTELLIFHNYYAKMVRSFSKDSFMIKKGGLINNHQKASKKEIPEEVIDQVNAFIEKRRNDNTLNRKEKTFKKLIITTNTVY